MTPILRFYAVHGDNPEIISILEENKVYPYLDYYSDIIKDSEVYCLCPYLLAYGK